MAPGRQGKETALSDDDIPEGAPDAPASPEPAAQTVDPSPAPPKAEAPAETPARPDREPEPEPEREASPPPPPPAPVHPPVRPAPPIAPPAPAPAARPPAQHGRLRRIILAALAVVILGPPLLVLIYRIVPPPGTILMVQRAIEGHGWDYRWRPLSQISPALVDAAVASEDAGFCSHHGFDFDAMEKAMKHNQRRPDRIKGGSTISQQTAKNVFLWPGRDYVRKGIEAGYTVLIETVWGKRRIMETYLNVVEFGPGVYGAQAAAQTYFHEDASQLSPAQAARLVAVLPRPLKWSAEAPGRYVAGRTRKIDGRIGTVREAGLADCVLR